MGDVKNLERTEAVKKIQDLAEDISICMFCTNLGNSPFETRPMSTRKVDDNGNIWFLSSDDSNKNFEIKVDEQVQLVYSKPSQAHFLSVYGKAEVIKDYRKIEEVWTSLAKAWFPGGKNDPNVSAIRVTPEQAYYWDTRSGKMISLIKIATAALTGNPMDDSIEGSLEV